MLSDTIFEAIQKIVKYEEDYPEQYAGFSDHIRIVKSVMHSLLERLDEMPGEPTVSSTAILDDGEQERLREMCEMAIGRWRKRLQLIDRMTVAFCHNEREIEISLDGDDNALREHVFRLCCERWNVQASDVAADALGDMLSSIPEDAEELVGPISRLSPYWTEQIARAVLGRSSDDTGDFAELLEALETIPAPSERKSAQWWVEGF